VPLLGKPSVAPRRQATWGKVGVRIAAGPPPSRKRGSRWPWRAWIPLFAGMTARSHAVRATLPGSGMPARMRQRIYAKVHWASRIRHHGARLS